MNDFHKTILYDIFQWLIVLSVPFIISFYWPNHDERLMKFLCFQIYTNILLCLSFIFPTKRNIDNLFPALFFILGFFNLFTHGMSDNVNIGLGFIIPAITGIYVISNHLHQDSIPKLKKSIVITCLLNCFLFLMEYPHKTIIFNLDLGSERASGFMLYPANFSLLCAVSLFIAWNWCKFLCLPIGLCLILSQEYSVIAGVVLVIGLSSYRIALGALLVIGFLFLFFHWNTVYGKILLREKFLFPVFQNVWSRPLDGWGVGEYNRLPNSFFGFVRGNWSEMHCEPLDLLFSMGIIGIGCAIGWAQGFTKSFTWNEYTKSIVVILVTSCFHSIFHFCDSLWLSIIVYSLYEVEKHEYATTY